MLSLIRECGRVLLKVSRGGNISARNKSKYDRGNVSESRCR